MERNYDDLKGAQENAGGGNFIDIDMATCRLKIYGREGQFASIDGYFDGIHMEDKEANKEAKIPARTEYHILFSTVLDKGQAPTQARLRLSDHWKSPGWAAILNALAGASMNVEWDGYFNLNVWGQGTGQFKDGKEMLRFKAVLKDRSGKYLENAYPWDESTQRLKGVPESKVIGTDEFGNEKRDWTETRNFWKQVAADTARRFTGAEPAPVQTQQSAPQPQPQGVVQETILALANASTGSEDAAGIQKLCNAVKRKIEGQKITPADQVTLRQAVLDCAKNAGLSGSIDRDWNFQEDAPGLATDDLPF